MNADPPAGGWHAASREIAPAKATLTLHVLGRRADGYHDIEALTIALSEPHDVVEVEPVAGEGVTLEVIGDVDVPTGEENLAWQAAVLAGGGRRGHGVHVRLHKHIPAQAGLGGGSADAAAVLRALGAPPATAAQLGSDVPFCLTGGAAWMRGRGEIIEAIEPVPDGLTVFVAVPPFGLSTPAVYRMWDELGGPAARRRIEAPRALRHLTGALFNDLEAAAEAVEPRLRPWRESLETAAGQQAVLAGSGSAYLLVADEGGPDRTHEIGAQLPRSRLWQASPVGGL